MDDCFLNMLVKRHRRPGLRSATRHAQNDPASAFNDCLNAVHPRVQFTREDEDDNAIAFLDVKLDVKPTAKFPHKFTENHPTRTSQ